MKQNNIAIIGAAWGDEGKGLLTDAFSGKDTIVVRSNSGAQAGHTVETPDGRRHVFHHIGSGSFRGAATYLSRFFVSNPIAFEDEYQKLPDILDRKPKIYVHPDSLVTTPFDIMINQMSEESRGTNRHGSCGLGFNETIQRSQKEPTPLTVDALHNGTKASLTALLQSILTDYVPKRLRTLGVTLSPIWRDRLNNPELIPTFLDLCRKFLAAVIITPASEIETKKAFFSDKSFLFENAQGLMLDAERGPFPYVTNSRTGLTNIAILTKDFGIEDLTIIHATRAYATRHGAGPFPRENTALSYTDETNLPNPWQGTLRFGDLDIDCLKDSIHKDYVSQDLSHLKITSGLAVTCLDQIPEQTDYWLDGKKKHGTAQDLLADLQKTINTTHLITSYGPTRTTCRRLSRL